MYFCHRFGILLAFLLGGEDARAAQQLLHSLRTLRLDESGLEDIQNNKATEPKSKAT